VHTKQVSHLTPGKTKTPKFTSSQQKSSVHLLKTFNSSFALILVAFEFWNFFSIFKFTAHFSKFEMSVLNYINQMGGFDEYKNL